MRNRRLLIGLFLLATVLVDWAAVRLLAASDIGSHESKPGYPFVYLMLVATLWITQMSLAAIWLAMGRGSGAIRLALTTVIVVGWDWVIRRYCPLVAVSDWGVVLAAQVVIVSVPLAVARLCGLRLVDMNADMPARPSGDTPRFQFSIADMLGWTTAIAFALGMSRYLAETARDWHWPLECASHLLDIRYMLIPAAALWVVLGDENLLLRLAGLVGACLIPNLNAWGVSFEVRSPMSVLRPFYEDSVAKNPLPLILLIASLLVFRVAGYRLRWRPWRGQAALPEAGKP